MPFAEIRRSSSLFLNLSLLCQYIEPFLRSLQKDNNVNRRSQLQTHDYMSEVNLIILRFLRKAVFLPVNIRVTHSVRGFLSRFLKSIQSNTCFIKIITLSKNTERICFNYKYPVSRWVVRG